MIPTESPQLRVPWHRSHRKPTDKTALSGTRRHDCYHGFVAPYKLFVQVARLMAMVFTRVLSDEWTSEKRKVDSSILSLTTDRLRPANFCSELRESCRSWLAAAAL